MRTIEVCLTPDLIYQHDLESKIVVVVDIFRATSCIVTGFAHGVETIRPVETIEEMKKLGKQGYLMAGEREGIKIPEFDLGNSPFDYQEESIKGKKIALSTTNGSQAIIKSAAAQEVIIGSFLNKENLVDYLFQKKNSVLINCSGWKGTPSLEDTLFAGALIDECDEKMDSIGDSAFLAHQLYVNNHENLLEVVKTSSHAKRLANFGIEKDIEFCMKEDKYAFVPKLIDGELKA